MRIGRRIGRAFRRVTRGLGRIAKFGSKVFSLVSKPLSMLTKPLQGIVDKVLTKLPFGQLLRPMVSQFLSNPLSLMTPGGVGALGSLLNAAKNPLQLAQTVAGVTGALGGPMNLRPEAAANMLQMVAANHARMMFPF